MTILVGIIGKSVIVLASDSQTTYSSSVGATKRLNAQKVSVVEFVNGKALVAQAGDATLSGRAVEIMQSMAASSQLADYRSAADVAEKAVRKLKEDLRYQALDCTSEELQNWIRRDELHFELMIANYHDGKPFIFTIDFIVGIGTNKPHRYVTSGCGAAIADYILSWFDLSKLEDTQAALTAIYVVEEVKKVDPFCGGPTKLSAIDAKNAVWSFPEDKMAICVSRISEIDRSAKEQWGSKMDEVMRKAGKQVDKNQ